MKDEEGHKRVTELKRTELDGELESYMATQAGTFLLKMLLLLFVLFSVPGLVCGILCSALFSVNTIVCCSRGGSTCSRSTCS